jgi:hypothetical protein
MYVLGEEGSVTCSPPSASGPDRPTLCGGQLPIGRVRWVAVSATIPNPADIAQWLGAGKDGLRVFGEEVRPVKLTTIVRGTNVYCVPRPGSWSFRNRVLCCQ